MSAPPILDRIAFKQSRLSDYFTEKELSMQIGGTRDEWALILIKELIDNGLDAAEATVAPVITVAIDDDSFVVTDNGSGLPDSIIIDALDYSVRVSTKGAVVSPTRGRLGNALKCVYAAPYVINGNEGRVVIDTAAARHVVTVTYDDIRQEPTLNHSVETATVQIGTSIKVDWQNLASYVLDASFAKSRVLYVLIETFAAANPHATFHLTVNGQLTTYQATKTQWDKWRVTQPTPAHWYTTAQMTTLISRHLTHNAAITTRQFVSQFAGLARTQKQKDVIEDAGISDKLIDLVRDTAAVTRLLDAMVNNSKPPKPQALGIIGKEHLITWASERGGESSFKYKMLAGEIDGLPYVIEVALCIAPAPLRLYTTINWSAPAKQLALLNHLLTMSMIDNSDPLLVFVSIAIAEASFSDHGKSRIELKPAIIDALDSAIKLVAKDWVSYKKTTRRNQEASAQAAEEHRKRLERSKDKYNATSAANKPGVMLAAYMKASGGGRLPANARMIMYAIKPTIIELTENAAPWSHSARFTQNILPDYLVNNPKETASWDVVFDDRGHFEEPHTGKRLGLGTVAVRQYIAGWLNDSVNTDKANDVEIDDDVETKGPALRFKYALFIEKEGFRELLDAAKFAERYDLAIFSTKGMSTVAARQLADALASVGVVILTLHDFDKAGLKIHSSLTADNHRYRFNVRPTVIELGLRLDDVIYMGLDSEPVEYESKKDPRIDIMESGGTADEANFLCHSKREKTWIGDRVELNAMTATEFVDFLDRKLIAAGVKKVIPESDALAVCYQRVYRTALAEPDIKVAIDKANSTAIDAPDDLMDRVNALIEKDAALSWDQAISTLARDDFAAEKNSPSSDTGANLTAQSTATNGAA